jgi:uncharacterized protein YndB with AHSA1/START domain
MNEDDGYSVRIERAFEAPVEAVFDAWTSAEVLRRWFHCGPDWETPTAEVDRRIGGIVRIVMRMPDGTEHGARGQFKALERPNHIAMSWTFDDDPSNEQMIELSFSQSGDTTTVVMINSRISSDRRRDDQEFGWNGCLDELARVLQEG